MFLLSKSIFFQAAVHSKRKMCFKFQILISLCSPITFARQIILQNLVKTLCALDCIL